MRHRNWAHHPLSRTYSTTGHQPWNYGPGPVVLELESPLSSMPNDPLHRHRTTSFLHLSRHRARPAGTRSRATRGTSEPPWGRRPTTEKPGPPPGPPPDPPGRGGGAAGRRRRLSGSSRTRRRRSGSLAAAPA
ncbi:hypothetical protein TorRG33x02_289250 [Trema orientale]|uniref:Uncharacterized protein n=1 Tax=Trema orientale TaxID=63057 RepID=A0A2P5CDB9_TREOI|nr:hypothetical protein TorRG33x02_289250 [Trema orientale]